MIISCSVLLGMKNVPDKSGRENKTHTNFVSNKFFFKLCHLLDNVNEYCRTRQATDDNMAHMLCMLHDQGDKQTLGIK